MKVFLTACIIFAWLAWAVGIGSDLIFLFRLVQDKKRVYQKLKREQQEFIDKGLQLQDFGWKKTFKIYISQTQTRLLYYVAMLAGLGLLTLILAR